MPDLRQGCTTVKHWEKPPLPTRADIVREAIFRQQPFCGTTNFPIFIDLPFHTF
jgi:hypothetical protein